MKTTSTSARDVLRRYWPWITVALLIVAALIYSLASGSFQIASEPPGGFKNVIRPSDANYPKLNPQPKRAVTISGTMPGNLPIQLISVYSTDMPTSEFANHKGCYRTEFIGPWRPLYAAHPLSLAKTIGKYETTVTVDKYEPGFCRWHLARVVFVLGDEGSKSGNDILDSGAYWTAVVFDESSPSRSFRGPINIWCRKLSDREACTVWGGLPGKLPDDVPANERGSESQTLVTSDMSLTVLNFHDFDALPAAATAAPETAPLNH